MVTTARDGLVVTCAFRAAARLAGRRVEVVATVRARRALRAAGPSAEVRARRRVVVPRGGRIFRNVSAVVDLAPFAGASTGPLLELVARVDLRAGGLVQARRVLGVRVRQEAPGALPAEAVEGSCPVCGEGLEAGVVECAGCRTPHHGECWEWAGGCAVYGCLGSGAGG